MKNIIFLSILLSSISVSYSQTQTTNKVVVEYFGSRMSIVTDGGVCRIYCNPVFTEVCFTTGSFDSRLGTTINLNNYNGAISPNILVELEALPDLSITTINLTSKFTSIDPSTMFIQHVFIFE